MRAFGYAFWKSIAVSMPRGAAPVKRVFTELRSYLAHSSRSRNILIMIGGTCNESAKYSSRCFHKELTRKSEVILNF